MDVSPRSQLLNYVPNSLPPVKIAGTWMTPRHYVRIGASKEATPASGDINGDTKVVAALRAGPATATQLMKRTGMGRTQLDRRLDALETQGRVRKDDDGTRGHPYEWRVVKKEQS